MAKRMKEVVEVRREDDVIVIVLDRAKVATGHLRINRGGRHRDRRRPARVNDRRWKDG
jgi:hypothetical protein